MSNLFLSESEFPLLSRIIFYFFIQSIHKEVQFFDFLPQNLSNFDQLLQKFHKQTK